MIGIRSAAQPGGSTKLEAPVAPASRARALERVGVLVGVTDTLALLAGFLGAHLIRFGLRMPSLEAWLLMAVFVPAWAVISSAWRLHQFHRFSPAEEFRRLISAVSLCVVLVWTVSFWTKGFFSRAWIGLSWVISLVLVLAVRRLWHSWLGRQRVSGALSLRTLIVGTNHEAERLADLLKGSSVFQPVGFVWTGGGDPKLDGLPRVGDVERILEGSRSIDADCLFVASTAVSADQMSAVARAARREGLELRVSANLPEVHSTRVALQPIDGVMTLALQPVHLTGAQAVVKRTFDIVVSGLSLILLSPVSLLIALVIKVDSTGPIHFRQERVGRHQRPFTLLKFRTMVADAEAMQDTLRDANEVDEPLFKIRNDPRTTRVGRFLRRWSLDELPQLWNVLRGDMSLVGPRPSLAQEVAQYEPWHLDRLEVRPGMTGLWQVSGRSALNFDDYVRLDLYYIENWSLAYDLFVMARTIPAVVRRTGSY